MATTPEQRPCCWPQWQSLSKSKPASHSYRRDSYSAEGCCRAVEDNSIGAAVYVRPHRFRAAPVEDATVGGCYLYATRLCSAHVDNSQGRLLSLYCSPAVHCSVTPTRAIKFAAADSGGALGDVWPPSRGYTDSTGHRLHQHLHGVPGGTPSTLTPESWHRTTTKWRAPTTSTSPKLSRVIVYKRHRRYLSGSIESTSTSTPTSSSTSSTR